MKTSYRLPVILAFALGLGVSGFSADEATDDWVAYMAAVNVRPPTNYNSMEERAKLEFYDQYSRGVAEASWAYFENHPADSRRWEAAFNFINRAPVFVAGFKPEYADEPRMSNVLIDEAAKAEWEDRKNKLERAFAAATDVPVAVRQRFGAAALQQEFSRVARARNEGESVDLLALGAKVKAHAEKFNDRGAASLVQSFGRMVESYEPNRLAEAWTLFVDSSNQAVAHRAAEQLRVLELLKEPLDISFTAVDGREVDVEKLRGKVVLVDFWAIWCGPCIDELPNVKQVYADYHDKGFEIIGISLDNAGDREKLLAFTEERELPWPQYFDGQGWKNEIARRYAITAIPAMFLLDQEGEVVSTNARGPKLEREVKRLLGL